MKKNRYLKLRKYIDGSYYFQCNYSESENDLFYLSEFLTSDVQCGGGSRWKKHISNLADDGRTGGNISFLDRVKDKIIISSSIDEDPNPITYEITIKNLLEVLDQWEQLCKEKPQEIWIFEEDGKVWLEGKN